MAAMIAHVLDSTSFRWSAPAQRSTGGQEVQEWHSARHVTAVAVGGSRQTGAVGLCQRARAASAAPLHLSSTPPPSRTFGQRQHGIALALQRCAHAPAKQLEPGGAAQHEIHDEPQF
jgi:hypothetical protein